LSTTSTIGVYGGMAMASREKEIFSTIRNGIAKKNSSHRNGMAITAQRPEGR